MTVIKTVWYWQYHRQIDKWYGMKSSERDPYISSTTGLYIYRQVIFSKDVQTIQSLRKGTFL